MINLEKVKIIKEKDLPSDISDLQKYNRTIINGDTGRVLDKIINSKNNNINGKQKEDGIDLIVTSPPYFLNKEYEEEYTYEEYLEEQKHIISKSYDILNEFGSIYWNVAQTPVDKEIIPLGVIFYNIFKSDLNKYSSVELENKKEFYLKNWIIWRFNGGLNCKNRLTGRYENVLWFVKDKDNYTFNLDEIRIPSKWQSDPRCNPLGKNPTDIWDIEINEEDIKYFLINHFSKYAKDKLNKLLVGDNWKAIMDKKSIKNFIPEIWEINRVVNNSKERTPHPAQFPEELVKRIIKASTKKGDFVLDIFNGSGTTGKVAEELGRNWIGIEKEEKYCEIAKNRIDDILITDETYSVRS